MNQNELNGVELSRLEQNAVEWSRMSRMELNGVEWGKMDILIMDISEHKHFGPQTFRHMDISDTDKKGMVLFHKH